jgi:hypothetical protein
MSDVREEVCVASPDVMDDPAVKPLRNDSSDTWQCFVCVGTTEGKAAKEVITLSCGHSVHAACWVPCVLPTLGEDSAQARYVEDRLGRKCGFCRTEFSEELAGALKDRRALIRQVRKEYRESRARSDPALQRILRLVRGAGLAAEGSWLAQLPSEDDTLADPRLQPMQLDMGDLMFALSGAGLREDNARKLGLLMRAELQKAGHSPSGTLETLAHSLLQKGLANKGFFFQLLKKELLLKSEPLRTLIEEQLAPLIEAERGKAMLDQSTPQPVFSPQPVFYGGDALAALGPTAMPPPPPLPHYTEQMAQMASMGFGRRGCLAALRATDGNVDAAIAIVLNMGHEYHGRSPAHREDEAEGEDEAELQAALALSMVEVLPSPPPEQPSGLPHAPERR